MTKCTLIASILLLSLFTYTSAQNRNANESLAGLKAIGVIVKYGRVDGLEPAMQPTILHTVQDRARARLRAARVPLLPATDETKLVGQPRLVFTLTLKRPSDTPPALLIDGRFYQRVRLERDRAKEMELPTWSMGYVWPELSPDMLIALVEEQLDAFIDAYQTMNPVPPRVDTRTGDPPVQVKNNANALQGLTGIRLLVSLRFIQLAAQVDKSSGRERLKDPAFSQMLQTEAENKFKQVGIPLLRNETERVGRPLLEMSITLGHPNFQAPAIDIGSKLWQDVRLVRDARKETYVVTWESQTNNDGPITDEAVRQVLSAHIDEFIEAYRAANPQPSSAPTVKAQ